MGSFVAAQQVMPPPEQIPGTKEGGHEARNHIDGVCQNPLTPYSGPSDLLKVTYSLLYSYKSFACCIIIPALYLTLGVIPSNILGI